MDTLKGVATVGLIILVVIGLAFGLVTAANSKRNVKDVSVSDSKVVDYKNGVYYFDYTEANFANALSKFISEHPELELISFTGDGNASYGRDDGYFVVFRKKVLTPESPK